MDKFIRLAFKNKGLILESKKCACYHCQTMLDPSEVEFMEETDGKYTGVCPHCGIDSVIDDNSVKTEGRELNEEFLKELHDYAF